MNALLGCKLTITEHSQNKNIKARPMLGIDGKFKSLNYDTRLLFT